MEKNKNEQCTCELIDQVGSWNDKDGERAENHAGPIVRCMDCDAEFNLTWNQWKKIPNENKIVPV